MPQFRDFYSRYRKAEGGEEVSFSKEDMRRVESFANIIEKKLLRVIIFIETIFQAKKTFHDVFINKVKVSDGCMDIEILKSIINVNLQLEESLD
jgi:hypothetical protein